MGSYEHSSLISHAQDYQLPIAAVLSYQSCKLFFIKNILCWLGWLKSVHLAVLLLAVFKISFLGPSFGLW